MKQQALTYTFLIVGGVIFVLLGVLLIAAWPHLLAMGTLTAYVIEGLLLALAVTAVITAAGFSRAFLARYSHNTYRFEASEQGNYDALLNPRTSTFIKPEAGQYAPLPALTTYSPRYSNTVDAAPSLPAPGIDFPQVALSTIIEELAYNQLQFTFGTLRETGERLTTTLPRALHIQLTGASGQGKSVESTSILTQLCVGNDPEHLELAFIDHEEETTAPFHAQPHVRYLATTADQAAKTLHNLVRELDRRDKERVRVVNPNFTAMLIFIEEFLALKRMMSERLRDQALEDFTQLSLRGRKRKMFLYTVGQTAYSEKEMREAQAQFQSILTFALKSSAARSAGMAGNSEMLNKLWSDRREGQFLLQSSISKGEKLCLAPLVNEHMIPNLLAQPGVKPGVEPPAIVESDMRVTSGLHAGCNRVGKRLEPALQAKAEQIMQKPAFGGANRGEVIADLWGIKQGRGDVYQQACAEYSEVMRYIVERAREA